jgi:hypothetical protein
MSNNKLGNEKFDGDVFMTGAFKKSIDEMFESIRYQARDVTITVGGVPLEGFNASHGEKIITKPLDERTYDFMQAYLRDHGFTDAANELKNVKKFFEF